MGASVSTMAIIGIVVVYKKDLYGHIYLMAITVYNCESVWRFINHAFTSVVVPRFIALSIKLYLLGNIFSSFNNLI